MFERRLTNGTVISPLRALIDESEQGSGRAGLGTEQGLVGKLARLGPDLARKNDDSKPGLAGMHLLDKVETRPRSLEHDIGNQDTHVWVGFQGLQRFLVAARGADCAAALGQGLN